MKTIDDIIEELKLRLDANGRLRNPNDSLIVEGSIDLIGLASAVKSVADAAAQAQKMRIQILSRGVDELFEVRRSETTLAVAAVG